MTAGKGTRPSSSTPLMERAEWLSTRDIADVFGFGLTKAYRVCQTLPHIYVGRSICVNKALVASNIRWLRRHRGQRDHIDAGFRPQGGSQPGAPR